MKDFLGNKLEIGDPVVYITPGYRDFSKGLIKKFTKCFVIITPYGSKNDEFRQYPSQIIKYK